MPTALRLDVAAPRQGIMGIGEFDEEAEHLPESDRDDDWDTARDCAVQDEDGTCCV